MYYCVVQRTTQDCFPALRLIYFGADAVVNKIGEPHVHTVYNYITIAQIKITRAG